MLLLTDGLSLILIRSQQGRGSAPNIAPMYSASGKKEVVDLTGDSSGDEESEKLVKKLAQEQKDDEDQRRKVSTG